MAVGNQHTYDHLETNFNVRLSDELRKRLAVDARRARKTRADVIREALEHYLPILETLHRMEREDP